MRKTIIMLFKTIGDKPTLTVFGDPLVDQEHYCREMAVKYPNVIYFFIDVDITPTEV